MEDRVWIFWCKAASLRTLDQLKWLFGYSSWSLRSRTAIVMGIGSVTDSRDRISNRMHLHILGWHSMFSILCNTSYSLRVLVPNLAILSIWLHCGDMVQCHGVELIVWVACRARGRLLVLGLLVWSASMRNQLLSRFAVYVDHRAKTFISDCAWRRVVNAL